MAKKKEVEDTDPVALLIAGLNDSARKPNNLMYRPHEKQLQFHGSAKKGRQYIGGNRSGKTTGGINEDIWWLLGTHPYLKTPEPPVIGRITTVDFKNGAEKIIIPNLAQWIPPSALINGSWTDSYNGATHTLHLANKSELEIMSYDQELEKFAGVPRHFIHFDEEPPQDIFQECQARLVDYGGRWWMTMTPVEGMTWTYDMIFQDAESGQNPLIDVIKVKITDNTYLKTDAILDLLAGYANDEEQQRIRGTGEYIAIGGLVFKHFNPEKHVVPPRIPPKEWTHYVSLDAGYNNPTAVYWHAVDPKSGAVITYHEHYKSEMTTFQHSEVINEYNAKLRSLGIIPFLHIADPAIEQRQQTTGHSIRIEYANYGINFALGKERNINAGLDKMNEYHRTYMWFVTEDCPCLLREFKTYKRSQYATSKLRDKNNKKEEPQKKNDHGCDSCRYFFSFMPDLNIPKDKPTPTQGAQRVATMLSPGTTFDPAFPIQIDRQLSQELPTVFITDEYVGEW